jgi:uncharacterized protein YuzB (UPF0349 family)
MKQKGFRKVGRATAEAISRRRMQICLENRLARRPDLLDQLRGHGYAVETEACLDQCTRCDTCALALVCGRFEYGDTADELVRKLRKESPRTEGNW